MARTGVDPAAVTAAGADAAARGATRAATAAEAAIDPDVALDGIDEHLVMLTFDFVPAIAERAQKILVGAQDPTFEIAFDHRQGSVDSGKLVPHVQKRRMSRPTTCGMSE